MGTRLALVKAVAWGTSPRPGLRGRVRRHALCVWSGQRRGGGAAVVTARFCWAPVEGATNPPRLICPQDCAVKTCQAPWRQWLSFPC